MRRTDGPTIYADPWIETFAALKDRFDAIVAALAQAFEGPDVQTRSIVKHAINVMHDLCRDDATVAFASLTNRMLSQLLTRHATPTRASAQCMFFVQRHPIWQVKSFQVSPPSQASALACVTTPVALVRSWPSLLQLRIISRSNSARPRRTVRINLPCAVVVSAQLSRNDLERAPLSVTAPSRLSKSLLDRASLPRPGTTSA